jgi:hypothetical protein
MVYFEITSNRKSPCPSAQDTADTATPKLACRASGGLGAGTAPGIDLKVQMIFYPCSGFAKGRMLVGGTSQVQRCVATAIRVVSHPRAIKSQVAGGLSSPPWGVRGGSVFKHSSTLEWIWNTQERHLWREGKNKPNFSHSDR